MRINPKDKMINSEKMEKWVLRKSFEKISSRISSLETKGAV